MLLFNSMPQLADDLHQYNVFSLFFSWFAPANLWLTFSIVIDLTTTQGIEIFGTQAVVSISTFLPISEWCAERT